MSKTRTALVLLVDAMLVIALILLMLVDQIVHSTLYNYGLVFNYEWAQPYWLYFKIGMFLIATAILIISVVDLPRPS